MVNDMIGNIFFINMPYSDFKQAKARPVLVFQQIDKNDILILPLTTNIQREGVVITNDDLKKGNLKRDSIVIVPKLTAIDLKLLESSNFIAKIKTKKFKYIHKEICEKLNCIN